MLGTLGNTRKIEVIPSYARKNKSAHGLPRQEIIRLAKNIENTGTSERVTSNL